MDHFEGCNVIFHNVKEWYSSKKPIRCQFSVKDKSPLLENSSDCFIGIFPVGWENLLSSITKKSFSIVEIRSSNLYQVEFLDNELPPESYHDEFFQFCFYNIKTEHVYGASCPFQMYDNGDSTETFVVCGSTASISPKHKGKFNLINGSNTADDKGQGSANNIINESWMKDPFIDMDVKDGFDDDLESFMVVKQVDQREDIDQLKRENKALKNEKEQLVLELDNTKKEIEIKTKQNLQKLKESIAENEQIGAMSTKLNLEKGILQTELQTAREQEENLKSENNELRNEILSLKQNVRQLEEKRDTLENENQRLFSNYQNAAEEQGKVEQETKMIEKHLADTMLKLKGEQQKNECLHVELDKMSDAIETLSREKQEIESSSAAREKHLTSQVADFTEQNIALQNEVNEKTRNLQILENKMTQIDIEKAELKQQISDMEEIFEKDSNKQKKTIDNFKEKIENQEREIEDRDNHISELQKLRKEDNSKILKLNYLIENELSSKNTENEQLVHELQSRIKDLEGKLSEGQQKLSSPSKSEVGSMHALKIAYESLKKQLKHIKEENEKLKLENISESTSCNELNKENEELKLRICVAKKAYEKKYNEWQNLKDKLSGISLKDSCKQNQESEIESLKKQMNTLTENLLATTEELEKQKNEEIDQQMKIEELKDKSRTLVQHYEGKIKLLEEENELLKKQQLQVVTNQGDQLDGATPSVKPRTRATELTHEAPPQTPQGAMLTQPLPSEPKPDIHIAYPPSMNKIDRDQKDAWLPAVAIDSNNQATPTNHKQQRIKANNLGPSYPPSNQLIGNRKPTMRTSAPGVGNAQPVSSFTLNGRGAPNSSFMQAPTQRCPVCNFTFPPGYSDVLANAHVNEHFAAGSP